MSNMRRATEHITLKRTCPSPSPPLPWPMLPTDLLPACRPRCACRPRRTRIASGTRSSSCPGLITPMWFPLSVQGCSLPTI